MTKVDAIASDAPEGPAFDRTNVENWLDKWFVYLDDNNLTKAYEHKEGDNTFFIMRVISDCGDVISKRVPVCDVDVSSLRSPSPLS